MSDRVPRPATHSFDEPSDELRLHVEAPSLEELFAEAGRALAELILPNAFRADTSLELESADPELVTIEATDRDALFADWINELIFRGETEHRVFVEFRFERLTDRHLHAWVRGVELAEPPTPVKAATLHDLYITEYAHGFSVTVTLDV